MLDDEHAIMDFGYRIMDINLCNWDIESSSTAIILSMSSEAVHHRAEIVIMARVSTIPDIRAE